MSAGLTTLQGKSETDRRRNREFQISPIGAPLYTAAVPALKAPPSFGRFCISAVITLFNNNELTNPDEHGQIGSILGGNDLFVSSVSLRYPNEVVLLTLIRRQSSVPPGPFAIWQLPDISAQRIARPHSKKLTPSCFSKVVNSGGPA